MIIKNIRNFVVFIQNNFKASLLIVVIIFIIIYKLTPNSNGDDGGNYNAVKIKLHGTILNSDKVVEQIRDAINDKKVKGILLEVNSPGGSVPPSVEIALELKHAKDKGKKVVVYANGLLTSGSYYSSIYANEIVSNPGSIIGSIGVISTHINVEKLLNKIGIKMSYISAGKYKEAGTPFRKAKLYEKKEITHMVNFMYKQFVYDVAKARNLNVKNYKIFADARIFTAKEALKIGLIDKIGIEYVARDELKKLINVKKLTIKKVEKSRLDKFIFDGMQSAFKFLNIKMADITHIV